MVAQPDGLDRLAKYAAKIRGRVRKRGHDALCRFVSGTTCGPVSHSACVCNRRQQLPMDGAGDWERIERFEQRFNPVLVAQLQLVHRVVEGRQLGFEWRK